MAKLYFDLIQRGLKTLDDVPAMWYAQVETLLVQEN